MKPHPFRASGLLNRHFQIFRPCTFLPPIWAMKEKILSCRTLEYALSTPLLRTRVRDNILKSKEQKNIQPTKGGHKMVTCQNYVSLFYRQITSCPSDGGIS